MALTGAGTDGLVYADAPVGVVPFTGSRTEAAFYADLASGTVPITGSAIELGPTSRHRRLFAADPLMVGSSLRSSIDFTR